MDQAPPPPSLGADSDDAPSFAALLARAGSALHTMSAALRRRGLWLVFGLIGGLIGGTAVAATSEPIVNPHRYYKATVNMTLVGSAMSTGSQPSAGWSLRLTQLAATAKSYEKRVAIQTGTSTTYVKNHITVIANPAAGQLSITAIDIDPELTAQVAYHAALGLNRAVVESVNLRTARQQAQLNSQLVLAQAAVTALQEIIDATPEDEQAPLLKKLDDAQAQVEFVRYQQASLDVTPPKFEISSMPEAVQINSKAYYLRWSLARNDVGAARIQANAQLIDAGLLHDSHTEKMLKILANETKLREVSEVPPAQHVALGMLAGLVLGLSGVVLGEAWDDRIHNTDHAVRATGFDLLTEIPRLSRRSVQALLRSGKEARTPRTRQAASRYQEAATILAHQLGVGRPSRGAEQAPDPARTPIVLVTSATPSEGKSTSSAALAAAFAQLDLKVLAVNGDYHRLSLRKNVRPIPNFVRPDEPCETSIPGVWLLDDPSATRSKKSGTETVAGLLRRIDRYRHAFDVVVLDTPPILVTTDATDFLLHADAVALVVRIEQTLIPSCERAGTLIRHRNVPVSGLIVTDVPLKMIDRNYGPGG